ncbi:energy-coupling factor ABC transporter ATP-binding protein [Salinispira pacifica]|uniref:ATPase component of energizing module of ECF transporter n=1 Tax=Salinispira pacifica TaxID=1307761 RepID=V5WEK0_9SPIO|nr:ABC transporter ATP-binding protein [Salinispira pacifica]AHC14040.1 ATPase component of energizing module of ECF transporter [Salinispira pacifica]
MAHELGFEGDFPIATDEASNLAPTEIPLPRIFPDETLAISPGTDEAEEIFAATDLSFSYGDTPVLSDLSFDIMRGEFLAIAGSNGAGKSTLARILMGLHDDFAGSVLFDGRQIGTYSPREFSRRAGFVFQNPEHQFVTSKVFDEVAFGLRLLDLPESEVKSITEDVLERFHLGGHRDDSPFTLSHGQKRRLSIATMLGLGQEVLILDEPTFGQDYANSREIMNLLRELNESDRRTVIMISHDLGLIHEFAHRIMVLNQGQITFNGPPSELFEHQPILREANLEVPALVRIAKTIERKIDADDRKLESSAVIETETLE